MRLFSGRRSGEMSDGGVIAVAILGLVFLVLAVFGGCYGKPMYNVYSNRLEGEATLAKSEAERKVQIEDAKAKEQAAKLLAGAEIERAKGVAEANKIIGDSLKNNPEYLTYVWIKEINADGNSVIYVPTEAGLPILEAGRGFGKPGRREPPPEPEAKKK